MLIIFIVALLLVSCCHEGQSLLEEGSAESTSGDILHRIQMLEQQNNLQSQQIDTQQQQISSLLQSVQSLTSQCNDEIQKMKDNIDLLGQKNIDVSFYAYLQNDVTNPPDGSTIVFDGIMTNFGGKYDNVHGVFTAPINGTYFFTLGGSIPPQSNSHHLFHLFITLNGKHIAYLFLDDNTTHWLQRMITSLVHLNAGDRVFVQSLFGQGVLPGYWASEDKVHCHFSGFLVHGD